jgi:glycosyltransferase involved in cell wall biosynthesis
MMTSKRPVISVVTATRNCLDSIRDCIESVASQSWSSRQHIVVDGASTDGTLAVLQTYRHQLAALHSAPDNGIYDALNKGIALSTGEIVGFLHADDVYASPNTLARIAACFQDPSVCAVYGDLQYVKRDNLSQTVRHWKTRPYSATRLAWGWMPPHPTLYVRREWYQRIGGFDTSFRIAADYLSIRRLFSDPAFHALYIPEVLVSMRLGGMSNKSIRNIVRKSAEDWRVLRETRGGSLGGVGALVWKNLSKLGQFI